MTSPHLCHSSPFQVNHLQTTFNQKKTPINPSLHSQSNQPHLHQRNFRVLLPVMLPQMISNEAPQHGTKDAQEQLPAREPRSKAAEAPTGQQDFTKKKKKKKKLTCRVAKLGEWILTSDLPHKFHVLHQIQTGDRQIFANCSCKELAQGGFLLFNRFLPQKIHLSSL